MDLYQRSEEELRYSSAKIRTEREWMANPNIGLIERARANGLMPQEQGRRELAS